jgi:uncharacterized protein YprB with RNaseH-like and TPR domain
MTMSKFGSRLREVVRAQRDQVVHHEPPPADQPIALAPTVTADVPASAATDRLAANAAAALGGEVLESPSGPCVVVERRYAAGHRHGTLRLGDCGFDAVHAGQAFPLLAGAGIDAEVNGVRDVLFVDLETTGLAGGAGTFAFLVGCAWFDGETFHVRQYMMPGHALERAQLAAVRERVETSAALVTYNGRSFDVPVLETRYLYHRQPPPTAARPHLDMLHVARRLWRSARPVVRVPGAQSESCTLGTLERVLFGVRRHGDVPGFEIPGRYFAFLRSGQAQPLQPVFEHNRLDLVSLAALTARALRLVEAAPEAAEQPRECYGLGRLFERVGALDRAEACYRHTLTLTDRSWHLDDEVVRGEALRAIALRCRRTNRHEEAASHWEAITQLRRCADSVRHEAIEALAIHHEHRSRDLDVARSFAERLAESARASADTSHRLARLARKIDRRQAPVEQRLLM